MSTDVEVLPPYQPTVASLALRPDDRGALVRPAAALSDIVQAFDDYQAMCTKLLVDDDYQHIGKKAFRKKSAWRKLAVAFGVSTERLAKEYERDARGRIVRAEVLMRALAPNGRYMDGMGACDVTERCCEADTCTNSQSWHDHCPPDCNGFVHFSKPSHDIPATAMTRATNRASADLFGFGEVSAEEVTDPGHGESPPAPRRRDRVRADRADAPQGPPPEGFSDHPTASESHRLVGELIKALPEGVDRGQLRAYKSEKGWPMAKVHLEHLASMAGEARRAFDEGEGRPFEASPQGPPESPDSASTEGSGTGSPEAQLERPCAACGEAEAMGAIEGVELCESCLEEERILSEGESADAGDRGAA